MKRFLIGLAIGIVLGGTGAYAVVRDKVKKAATLENAVKVGNATQDFADTIKSVFE